MIEAFLVNIIVIYAGLSLPWYGWKHALRACIRASVDSHEAKDREGERERQKESASQKRRQVAAVCRPASHSMNTREHRRPLPLSAYAPLRRRLLHNQNKAKICVSCFACAFLSCWAFHSNSRCFCAACCVSHASPALVVTHTHTYSDSHTYTYGRRLAQRFHLIFSSVSVSRS